MWKWLMLLAPFFCHAQVDAIAEKWKNDKNLRNASIGFCIRDARTSEIISEYNSQLSLIPASTLKIVTTYAALATLGRNFRFETKIHHTGIFDKTSGVIAGDLIITGFGDPTLQSENYAKESVTDKWANSLKEKGVKEITGNVVGDATYFERTIPDNWVWGDISNYFGVVPCALSFMDNKFKIIYSTGAKGSSATVVGLEPASLQGKITVSSSVTTRGTEDEAYVYGDPFSIHKNVKGALPPNQKKFEIHAALPDPALLCAEQMQASLIKAGIKCNNSISKYKKEDTLVKKELLYLHFSPTLDRIIYHTNMQSNNFYCESIVRALGKGNPYNGLAAIKNFWIKNIGDTTELFMTDGSGLSRANTITASLLTKVLCKIAADSIHYKTMNNSLPLAARHGSMKQMGKGTFIENNLRAKTGYINRVRSYCGYVTTKGGRPLAFSIIFNNYNCTAKEARLEIEKWMVALGEL